MAFWALHHSYNSSLGRLRISQATLGDLQTLSGRVVVKCKVGNKNPVSLCSMHTHTTKASCMLDIELEEKETDVVFQVTGCANVHLTGFYLGHYGQSGNVTVGNYGASQVSHVKTEFNALELGKDYEYKDAEVNGCRVRTMPSGLVIEEIQTSGNPIIAYHGCWAYVHYFGQIKSTGNVFVSNPADTCSQFKLGVGEVIKGLAVGVNGMHVGDKRRLTIPPSMGYSGPNKARSDVPADAWLVFEVYLDRIG
ncbi:hypothetical protein MKX01_029248 [Papaver californicum]|nr:hypothetical protein MKX01_029248 [Papaver californicum]